MTLTAQQLEQLERARALQAELLGQAAPAEGRSVAQIAYEAYGASVGGVNVRGEALPAWADTGPTVQEGWHAAVNAVQLETVRATQRAHGAAPG